jgi:FixJ family two-component response regulator
VITDLEMPRIGGKELTQSIRQHNTSVPVVMITGCADPAAMTVELKEAGVSQVISKPFQIAEILALKSMLVEKPAVREATASLLPLF